MPGYFVKTSKQIWKTSPEWVIWQKNKPNVRLVEKLKKHKISWLVKYKNRETNLKKQAKNEEFTQK